MEKQNNFFISINLYRQNPSSGIFVKRLSKNEIFYRFVFFISNKAIIFSFVLNEKNFETKEFKICIESIENIILKNFYSSPFTLISDNKFVKYYDILLEFAKSYGFSFKEKNYQSLVNCKFYLFYLYILNNFDLDCRDFGLDQNLGEKNVNFYTKILERI